MPRDERLAEPDALDELRDRRLTLGKALDDPEPVDVGERLVDEAQGPQLLGLVHDGRDCRAEVRGRGGQDDAPGSRWLPGGPRDAAGHGRWINDGLYQYALIRR